MRGVRKGSSPRNVSPDGQQARSMQQASAALRASLDGELATASAQTRSAAARTSFDATEKPTLRAALAGEQHYLCVYCERRVGDGVEPIEHWRPLSGSPRDALHWENLYLSCDASGTCDDCKGNSELRWDPVQQSLPWPTQLDYERCVGFTSDGRIYVRSDAPLTPELRRALELAIDDCDDGGQRRAAVLNLNHPSLVSSRAAAIDAERVRLARRFRDRTASREEKSAWANDLLQQPRRHPFVSIRVAYLEKQLGAGRST